MSKVFDLNQAAHLVVVSGIPAGDGGTGQFVAHLLERMSELAGNRIKLVSRPERLALWQIKAWVRSKSYQRAAREILRHAYLLGRFWLDMCFLFIHRRQKLILLHPQNLGYRLAIRLLESRTIQPLIYLLDSSFFCVASYNHVKGESGSCLRCIEDGFDQIDKNGCKPFPRLDWAAFKFAPRLQVLIKAGCVKVATQSLRQAMLAQRQFELSALPPVVGLWTQDFDEVFSKNNKPSPAVAPATHTWDVLFHGHCLDAKGASWTAAVAALCPDLRFMFPFPRPDWFVVTSNCSFVPCTWESGLRNEMTKSRFVIVPSLWSAPIEGALIKSIACAKAVVVVNNSTSFCDELPGEMVLKLSVKPEDGATELRHACLSGWHPDAGIRARWLDEFAKLKDDFVPALLSAALVDRPA